MTNEELISEARELVKHAITSTDEEVRGHRGTVARCLCGWASAWAVRDGSAESD